MHRVMTLGHMVATTQFPWQIIPGLHEKNEFCAEQLPARKGIQMMKQLQASYRVSV